MAKLNKLLLLFNGFLNMKFSLLRIASEQTNRILKITTYRTDFLEQFMWIFQFADKMLIVEFHPFEVLAEHHSL